MRYADEKPFTLFWIIEGKSQVDSLNQVVRSIPPMITTKLPTANATSIAQAEGAFSWWMNSQVLRDNILLSSASEVGIGYVYYLNSTYGGYFTALFARP